MPKQFTNKKPQTTRRSSHTEITDLSLKGGMSTDKSWRNKKRTGTKFTERLENGKRKKKSSPLEEFSPTFRGDDTEFLESALEEKVITPDELADLIL